MPKVLTRTFLLLFFLISGLLSAHAQSDALTIDLKKPEKYENKKLGSEKTETKKWTLPRRFVQNGITKFNWHFNARNRLQAILDRTKEQHKDDYTRLLTFYNYTLEATAREKSELDSVIYKANAGILLHDLRNSWVDNMYMLMGQAYYFKNEPDSAYSTFQYINYAFSPKEKDGYDLPIGSNANEGGNAFTISTKENNSLVNRAWSTPPSRNESFIWQIRTFLAKDEFAEAAGMIETLRNDPQFPDRLRHELYEVQAWWFYKREVYDSAAVYLEKALPNAGSREEKARWEYLIGQLYERSRKHQAASQFYERSVQHTLNPVMELYARLNSIRQNKGDDKVIQQNIDEVAKMARRDRYTSYRDIIYYMAAQMELERNNVAGAKAFLLKATRFPSPTGDMRLKSQSFLQLADLLYKEKDYREAKRFYDSASIDGFVVENAEQIEKRRQVLTTIAEQLDIISRQDSMLKIAAMPAPERDALIKKLVKQWRRQQGLKEEEAGAPGDPLVDDKNAPADLFGAANKGEWYFSNNALKSKGFTEFRGKWGNRPNVDNWRRQNAANSAAALAKNNRGVPATATDQTGSGGTVAASGLTYEALLANVPLTPQQQQTRTDSIGNAKFRLGKSYMEGLEDYASAIVTLEEFVNQYTYSPFIPEALFYLRYCYTKTGNTQKATEITAQLKNQYPDSDFSKLSAASNAVSADSAAKLEMTKRYENIYTLFIEGKFEEALAAKKVADSLYDKSYWTPQLLYIESMYYVKNRQDINARKVLNDLITTFPESPMAAKAKTMVDVIARRKEIEEYLTNLKIERPVEDSSVVIIPDLRPLGPPNVMQQDTTTVGTVKPKDYLLPDSVINRPVQPPVATQPSPDRKTTQQSPPPIVTQGQMNPPLSTRDSTGKVAAPKYYVLDTAASHMVVLVLDKVDQVYVTEARNAFNRYNRENNKTMNISFVNLSDDMRMMLIDGFPNAAAALAYLDKAKTAAPREVIPWLPANKYSFIIISHNNLPVLTNSKDIAPYRSFLTQSYPGRF